MGEGPEKKEPRSAVIIYTADGRRIKPPCPMCHRTLWGKLVPPNHEEGVKVGHFLSATMGDHPVAMGVQLLVCVNCGFLWHRTGSADKKPVEQEAE